MEAGWRQSRIWGRGVVQCPGQENIHRTRAGKSTCSCKGPRFDSQHIHSSSELSIILILRGSAPSLTSKGTRYTYDAQIDMQQKYS